MGSTHELGDLGPCRAKRGLLFLRDCKDPAVTMCDTCGRPVCQEHQLATPEGTLCPECGAADTRETYGGSAGHVRRRRHYYDHYGYSPFYYGRHRYYHDRDYRTFNDRDMKEHTPVNEELAETTVAGVAMDAESDYDDFGSGFDS